MKLIRIRRRSRAYVTIYSRPDCPLCDKAVLACRRVVGSNRVSVVNIDGNRELEDQFIFRVPVVYIDGRLVAEGEVTPDMIRQALKSTRDEGVSR